MSLLNPNVNEIGEKRVRCPACGNIHSFKIFYTNVAVSVGGYSVLPLNRKYTAICLGCKKLFTIDPDKGNAYLMNRNTPIGEADLEIR